MRITIDVTPELLGEVAVSQQLQIEHLRAELAEANALVSQLRRHFIAAEHRAAIAEGERKKALATLRGAEARRGPDWRAFNAAIAEAQP